MTELMRAAAFEAPGPPDVLRPMELPAPQAGPGQVRVRVRAAGVQPFDLGIRSGWAPPGLALSRPQIPGNELAGVIDQVGAGGPGWDVGAEVLGFTTLGCYAQYVVLPADQVVARPAGMPWEVAGGFSACAQTSHLALTTLGVGPGDTLLIHGAAGGVGTVATQLAQLSGARVIGTARQENHEYLRSLGATPVTYGEGLVERVRALAPEGVDVALDAAGPEGLRASVELVKDRSRITSIVAIDLIDELGVTRLVGQRSAARLGAMVDLHTQGKLRIEVRRTYPLERAADAHRELATRHGRGKVVLTID